jgi:hypothetical protein
VFALWQFLFRWAGQPIDFQLHDRLMESAKQYGLTKRVYHFVPPVQEVCNLLRILRLEHGIKRRLELLEGIV